MRGEDLREVEKSRFAQGSPPHARGRPIGDHNADNLKRITPACAGKTF